MGQHTKDRGTLAWLNYGSQNLHCAGTPPHPGWAKCEKHPILLDRDSGRNQRHSLADVGTGFVK